MRRIVIRALIIELVILLLVNITLSAKDKVDETQELKMDLEPSEFLLSNSNLGTDFWLSFFPAYKYDFLNQKIFVTPIRNATVKLFNTETQQIVVKEVEAFTTAEFKSGEGFSASWLTNDSEDETLKSLHLTSTEPVCVYVQLSEKWLGEGYAALPTEALGTEYYHNSYYDFLYRPEHPGSDYPGGFIVIATEDFTNVTIELMGIGKGYAETQKGHDIGDQINLSSMLKGETYMVCGDAESTSVYDLSGSRITSDKPVAVISFHTLTAIPSLYRYWWNYLVEMQYPTNRWGKEFYTVNLTRNGSEGNLGDFFRIMASERQTKWTAQYRDPTDGRVLGNLGMTLNKPGDLYEYYHGECASQPVVRGVSYWEADKPCALYQYAYSPGWDGDEGWQPIMFQVPPLEHFTDKPFMFVNPEGIAAEMNLFVIGDPEDPENKLLKSIMLDGEPLYNKAQRLLMNRIPNTNIYWVKHNVEEGVHYVYSDTKIGGYICRSKPASYGWPLVVNTNIQGGYDELPPECLKDSACGDFELYITEIRNNTPVPEQKDKGISKFIVFEETLDNYSFDFADSTFNNNQSLQTFIVDCSIIDPYKSAFAKFAVVDWGGNVMIDSISYSPEILAFNTEKLDFGKLRVGKEKELQLDIENTGDGDIFLNAVDFESECFTAVDLNDLPYTLLPGEKKTITVKFTPTEENESFIWDSVYVECKCVSFKLPLTGMGVLSHISVAGEFDFGEVEVGEKKCLETTQAGFLIENDGTDTLHVYSIEGIEEPFIIQNANPVLPFCIDPKSDVVFKYVCFEPTDSLEYEAMVTIHSDAGVGDSIANLFGKGHIEDTTTVYEEIPDDRLLIIPNPASGEEVILKFEDGYFGKCTLGLHDINGALLRKVEKNTGMENVRLSVADLASGIYYLRVNAGKILYFKKLVISR